MTVSILCGSVLHPVVGFSGRPSRLSAIIGAKQFGRVKQAIRFMVIFGLVSSSLVWLLVVCFPAAFIHLFNSEPALIEAGVPAIEHIFGFVLMSLHMNGQKHLCGPWKAKQAITFSCQEGIIVVPPYPAASRSGIRVEGVCWRNYLEHRQWNRLLYYHVPLWYLAINWKRTQ